MPRIALLDDYQNIALSMADWSVLSDTSITVFNHPLGGPAEVAAALQDFDIIGIMRERTPFPRRLLEKLPNLKLLVTTGMRNPSIDLDAARELGVTVCGTDGSGHPAAELTWGLILGLVRHIPREDREMRAGHWQTALGHGLNGKTLGVIGLGRLGSRVAQVGAAFGMEVIAWSPNLTPERAAAAGARFAGKEELLSTADIITLHMVLSERTQGLLGAPELALLKPTAYLINTSRGPLIDESALVSALYESRIAGAALDVYDYEPLPAGHPLRRLTNTVLTPHIGYVTTEAYRVFYRQMVEDIRAFLDGAPLKDKILTTRP